MKTKTAIFLTTLVTLLVFNNAFAIQFSEGNTYKVSFDLSQSALPSYERVYLMYDFGTGTMNPNDSVRANVWDDSSTLVNGFTLTNTSNTDYELWGQNISFPAGSAFNDSAGFFTFDSIVGNFEVLSIDVVLQKMNATNTFWISTDRITLTDINPVPTPEPSTFLLLGGGLAGLVLYGRKRKQ